MVRIALLVQECLVNTGHRASKITGWRTLRMPDRSRIHRALIPWLAVAIPVEIVIWSAVAFQMASKRPPGAVLSGAAALIASALLVWFFRICVQSNKQRQRTS